MLSCALCWLSFWASPASAQSTATQPREDSQLWGDLQASHALRPYADLLLNGGLRLGQNASHFVFEREGAGLIFKLGRTGRWRKYISISTLYAHVTTQPFAGAEKSENRVTLGATARIPIGRWTASYRADFDRRFIDPRDTSRFRNRLQLERPIHLAGATLRGFLSDEVYYEWRYHAWTRNRIILGAGKSLGERVSLDIYYLRQNDGFARPGDLNAVAFTLRTRF